MPKKAYTKNLIFYLFVFQMKLALLTSVQFLRSFFNIRSIEIIYSTYRQRVRLKNNIVSGHAFPQQFSGFKTNTHQAVNGSYKYTHLLNQNWFYLNCICSFFVSIVFQRFLIKICDYLTLK